MRLASAPTIALARPRAPRRRGGRRGVQRWCRRQLRYSLSDAPRRCAAAGATDCRGTGRPLLADVLAAAGGRALPRIAIVERPALADREVVETRWPASPLLRQRQLNAIKPQLLVVGVANVRGSHETWEVVRLPIPRMDRGVIAGLDRADGDPVRGADGDHVRRACGGLPARSRRSLGAPTQIARPGAAKRQSPGTARAPTTSRRLIAAHNAMESRIGAMLDRKRT